MKKFRALPIKKQLIYAFSIITFLMIVVSIMELVMLSKAEETNLNIEKSKEFLYRANNEEFTDYNNQVFYNMNIKKYTSSLKF